MIPDARMSLGPAPGAAALRRREPHASRTLPLALCAIAVALAGAVTAAAGSDPTRAQDQPPPVERRPGAVTGDDLVGSMRSDVRIVARGNHEIEEHRVGDNVYKIKVKPKNAPPYYLYDNDGSGNFQWRRGTELEQTQVPHWAIKRW